MDAAHTVDLCARFPLVTRDLYIVECSEGWHLLLRHALGQLEASAMRDVRAGREPLRVTRINERYGRLAIHSAGYDSEVLAIIHRAEDDSQRCCETCGCAGEPRWNHAGLLQVACNRCAGVPDDSSQKTRVLVTASCSALANCGDFGHLACAAAVEHAMAYRRYAARRESPSERGTLPSTFVVPSIRCAAEGG